jgi:hypothetical protein
VHLIAATICGVCVTADPTFAAKNCYFVSASAIALQPVHNKEAASCGGLIFCSRSPFNGVLDRILKAADRVLNLAGDLLRLAFRFELGIAGDLARDFLNLAFGLLDGALDSIFVRFTLLSYF